VTLAGTGGVGKTRLSIAVAEQVAGRSAEGVWFADLAPLSDPLQITPTILRLFDLREDSHCTPEETLVRALSSRTLLLVLDNCEHLLEACAALTHRLLTTCPGLRVLATSREALGLTGEHLYRVPSLSLPPGLAGVEKEASSLLEYAAVRLFVERARQASPAFRLTRSNAGLVVQVCHRLDGIPLALEMAAARVKSLSMAQIAARLEDRFHLLTGGSRAALPRQRTLQAAIDWSYDLLSAAERALFRRLSVFTGGLSLEAAVAVCAGADVEVWEVLDQLTSLVDKSLVVFEESAEGTSRYRLLETLRQYGGERLAESGETEALRSQHRDFFLRWAEEAEVHFYGPEQSAWYATVENDLDNLRAALEWCQKRREAERALRLNGALSPFWDVRGYYKEGLAHQIAALSLAGAAGTEVRARVLLAAGQLSVRQGDYAGDYAAARSLLEECLAIQQETGNRRGIIGPLAELANVAFHLGDHRLARARCEESLVIAQELGERRSAIGAFNMLGHLALGEGDHARARSFYAECLAISREAGDTRGIAGSLRGLGNVTYAQGDYAQARALLEECLEISRELGDKFGIAACLVNLGALAWRQGDYGRVRSFCEESVAIYQEVGDKISALHTLGVFGHIARAEGDYGRASALYQESLALRRELGDTHSIVQSLEDFAALAGRQGLPERAARLLGAAEALCRTLGRTPPAGVPEEYTRAVDTARAALGDTAFTEAWEEGRAMTMDQMVATMMEPPDGSPPG
jgi:non-specific serine/threonine protein kinase